MLNVVGISDTFTSTDLFDEVDALLEIHSKVDELPLDAFLLVFLLFQHEHVVVEELLETFVGVVDAQLLESVVLEGNKTSRYMCSSLRGFKGIRGCVHMHGLELAQVNLTKYL